ncbi:hypothetical protein COU53_00435 [Candidatus Pacearchaeota archaeon CG10_big_fil_rev_8_21_14_0_10_30_48]|nr:MAG: hypothetical protein COU53_00435 [Candidatus Pacearchaeota archaeon CG10_big_fil_rev_8_21_14_0_10_30_48]
MPVKKRAGGSSVRALLGFVAWLTGIIVSLSVAFAMIDGVLGLPNWLGGSQVALVAGWIVVVTTIVGVILAIVDYFS